MLTWDQWVAYGVTILAGGALGSAVTVLRKPASRSEMIKAAEDIGTAMLERQEEERKRLIAEFEKREKKLETVAADLEEMVIKLIAWADEAAEVARINGITLPARPKFRLVNGAGQ